MKNTQNIKVPKKILITAIAIVSVSTIMSARAQTTAGSARDYLNPCRKTIFSYYNNTEAPIGDHLKNIDSRAIKNFRKEFPEINNERWYKSSDGGYIADFNAGFAKTVVAFNKKGQLHHTINYYNEKSLPGHIWKQVKDAYYAYNILRIEEINFEAQKIYFVHLEGDTYHKIVAVTEENMMEVKSFRKA